MALLSGLRRDAGRWAPFLPAALAVWLILASTTWGAGVTPDSVTYASVATSLLEGGGFVRYNGNPIVHWAPGYPLGIAAVAAVGIPAMEAARLLNALVIGLIVLFGARWTREVTGSLPLALVVGGVLLLSRPLNEVGVFIWSEPLFILLMLLGAIRLQRFQDRLAANDLVWAGVWLGLAAATRYIGVACIAVGAVLVLTTRAPGARLRIRRTLLFGATAALPLALWLLRNVVQFGTLTGGRSPAATELGVNAVRAFREIGTWLLPGFLALRWPGVLAGAAALLVPLALLIAHRRGRGGGRADRTRPAWTMAWLAFGYTAFLVWATSEVSVDSIKVRLMSPAFVPLALTLAVMAHAYRDAWTPRVSRAARVGAGLFLVAWLGLALYRVLPQIDDRLRDRGYASAVWRDAELIELLRSGAIDGPIYTNVPDAVWVYTGTVHERAPRRTYNANTTERTPDLRRFAEAVERDGPLYLFWFQEGRTSYLYTGDELDAHFDVEVLRRTPEGALLRIGEETDPLKDLDSADDEGAAALPARGGRPVAAAPAGGQAPDGDACRPRAVAA